MGILKILGAIKEKYLKFTGKLDADKTYTGKIDGERCKLESVPIGKGLWEIKTPTHNYLTQEMNQVKYAREIAERAKEKERELEEAKEEKLLARRHDVFKQVVNYINTSVNYEDFKERISDNSSLYSIVCNSFDKRGRDREVALRKLYYSNVGKSFYKENNSQNSFERWYEAGREAQRARQYGFVSVSG